jgi:hypothetical protein
MERSAESGKRKYETPKLVNYGNLSDIVKKHTKVAEANGTSKP